MAHRRKPTKKHNKDLFSKRVTVWVQPDDKLAVKRISKRDNISEAEVMRTAFYDYYAKELN